MEAAVVTHLVERRSDMVQKWGTLLGLLVPINALLVFDRVALIVVTPILQTQLKLSLVDTTVLISAVMWSYALLQIPAGWLVTRFGIRAMMLGALFLWSSVTLLTPFAKSLSALIALRLLLGVGQSPDWPASVAAVRSWFGATDRSRGVSILLAGQYVGAALAAPVTTMIVSRTTWQFPFYLYGAFGLILTAAWFACYRERSSGEGGLERPSPDAARIFPSLLRSRQFWCLGGTYACIAFIACFINYMLPHYLMERRHIGYAAMGWLVGVPMLSLWISVFFAGAAADRIMKRTSSVWTARVPMGCLGMVGAGCATGAVDWVGGTVPMAACLCLSFFCLGFAQVSLWSIAQDLTKHYTGFLTGWASAWGNLLAAAGPILIAEVVESSGSWRVGLALPLVVGFLGAAMIVGTRPHEPLLGDTSSPSA